MVAGGAAWAVRHYTGRAPVTTVQSTGTSGAPAPTEKVVTAPVTPWRTSWALSLGHPGVLSGTNLTCRMIAHASLSGSQLRFRLVNYPATEPVTFSHLVAAVRLDGMNVDPATQREVTVGGRAQVSIAAGGQVLTDPVALPVRRGQDVALSIAVSSGRSVPWHYWSPQTDYCTAPNAGDAAADPTAAAFTEWSEDGWLAEMQVLPVSPVPTVAVYGDSLTDGLGLDKDTETRWTDRLETGVNGRLVALNFGVSGDQITGRAPVGRLPSRVASDVFAPAGVSAVIVEMGSNDIKAGASAAQILAQYRLIASEVARRGQTLIVATVPARHDDISAAQEHQRQLLNAGLRQYPVVADIDAALTNPDTDQLYARYNGGDGIHPDPAGVAVIARVMRETLARVPGPLGVAAR